MISPRNASLVIVVASDILYLSLGVLVSIIRLEDKGGTLGLLVTTTSQSISFHHLVGSWGFSVVPKLEVLASLQRKLLLGLAPVALETQHDLLCGLGLLVEDRLGLTTVTRLLSVVTSLTPEVGVSHCCCKCSNATRIAAQTHANRPYRITQA